MWREVCLGESKKNNYKIFNIKASYQRNRNDSHGTGKDHDQRDSVWTVCALVSLRFQRGFRIKVTSHFLPNGFIVFPVFYLQNLTIRGALLSLESLLNYLKVGGSRGQPSTPSPIASAGQLIR